PRRTRRKNQFFPSCSSCSSRFNSLSLRELRAAAGAAQTELLAFLHTAVPREELAVAELLDDADGGLVRRGGFRRAFGLPLHVPRADAGDVADGHALPLHRRGEHDFHGSGDALLNGVGLA